MQWRPVPGFQEVILTSGQQFLLLDRDDLASSGTNAAKPFGQNWQRQKLQDFSVGMLAENDLAIRYTLWHWYISAGVTRWNNGIFFLQYLAI